MPLFPPQAYRNTENTHRRGERADQPLATDVLAGTLYYVVDEGITEQSDGAAWTAWSGAGSRLSYVVNYSYSANTASPPGTNQARFNAGFPYTAVTKLYFDKVTADGQDVIIGLLRVSPGSLIYVQDKNDNTQYGTFLTTGFPINHTSWVEYDVTHYDHGSAIGGGQLVLVQSTWGPTTNPTFDPGSVPFGGGSGTLTEDNTNFFFDDTTDQLKVTGSVLSPLIIGGTGVTDDLSLQATSGVGTTGSWIFFKVGNNGATTAMEIDHRGWLGIGTTGIVGLYAALTVYQSNPLDIGYVANFKSNLSAYLQVSTGAGINEQAGFTFYQQTNGFEWRMAIMGNEANAMRWAVVDIIGGGGATTVIFYVSTNGNFIINDTLTDPATGSKCLIFGDGVAPASLDSNTAGLYANDVSGTVNMFAINEAGGSSQLTGFTAGSVIFADANGGFSQDSALTYNATNDDLNSGIFTATLASFPRLRLIDSSQAADAKMFQLMNSALTFRIKAVNDAESVAQAGIVLDRVGIITGAGQPIAKVLNSAGSQVLTTATFTPITFDNEIYDVGGCWTAGSPTRFTVPTGGGGNYCINGQVDFDNNSTGIRLVYLRKNGALTLGTIVQAPIVGDITVVQVNAIEILAAADYVEVIAYQNSGGNLNALIGGCSFSWLKVW